MSAPLSRIVVAHVADHDLAWAGGSAMAPISFGGRFGWLHQPATLFEGAVGVVLVPPLGRDERCVHRPMRLLADRLARAGYPTLRYDHLGQGDSLDLAGDGDALAVWVAGVRIATAFLKDATGVRRVVLGGVRIGASLAALAAAEIEAVDGLMLLAPVVSGKAWLRELRLAGAMSGTTSEAAHQAGGLEADGVALSPATVAALTALDLRTADLADQKVLLVAQNASVAALGEQLKQHGATVIQHAFAGYDPLFEDAHSNQAPEESFAQAMQWRMPTPAGLQAYVCGGGGDADRDRWRPARRHHLAGGAERHSQRGHLPEHRRRSARRRGAVRGDNRQGARGDRRGLPSA